MSNTVHDYRFDASASVAFSVLATTEALARKVAERFAASLVGGVDLDDAQFVRNGVVHDGVVVRMEFVRLYVDEAEPPELAEVDYHLPCTKEKADGG